VRAAAGLLRLLRSLGVSGALGALLTLAYGERSAGAATCKASALSPLASHAHKKGDILHEAEGFAHHGRYSDARALYLFALTRYPNDPEVVEALGRVDSWEGCWELAETEFRQVLSAHPEDDEARGGLIDLMAWQARWKEAEALLAEGLGKNPDSATLLSRGARLAFWRGDATEAAHLADKALRLEPKDDELRELREGIVLGTAGADFRLDAYPGGYPNVYTYGSAINERWRKFEFQVDSHIIHRLGGNLASPIIDGQRTLGATYHPTYGTILHLDFAYGNPAVAIPKYAGHGSVTTTLFGRWNGSFDGMVWAYTLGRDVLIFNPALAYEWSDTLELAVRWYTAYLSISSGDGHPFSSNWAHTFDLHGTWRPTKRLSVSADYSYGAQLEAAPTLQSIFSYLSHVLAAGADYVLRPDLGVRGLLGIERRAADQSSEVIWIASIEAGAYVRW
jgi:Flp pilus assembly protein TadD